MNIETFKTIDVSGTDFCIYLLKKCPKENKDCTCCGLYKMRDAISEELEGINNYIRSISKPTGYSFYDSWESVSK